MKLIADDKIPFLRGIPEQFAQVQYLPASQFTHDAIKEADVLLVRTPNKCTRSLLEGTQVRFIATTTIGFDHIDTEYCAEAGIKWTNAPGCNAASVAQYMLSSLFELSRLRSVSLHDMCLGIVGLGNVGTQVERLYRAYGLRYLVCDPPRAEREGGSQWVSLQTLAEQCDLISFHVPLTFKGKYPTYHLADEAFFRSLRRKPHIINVARGGVHDTQALLLAKKEGWVADLVLDCWENEPTISLPLLQEALIATPHLAGFSADGKANGTRMCLEAIVQEFGIDIPNLSGLVQPPAPEQPLINLNDFPSHRVEQAMLATFSPMYEDFRLRRQPHRFEYLRTHYNHPREYGAYTVLNATSEERTVLEALGFSFPIE